MVNNRARARKQINFNAIVYKCRRLEISQNFEVLDTRCHEKKRDIVVVFMEALNSIFPSQHASLQGLQFQSGLIRAYIHVQRQFNTFQMFGANFQKRVYKIY